MKRRREVLIEIEREIVISSHQHHAQWCPGCGKQVQMLTANEAAQMMNASAAMIHNEIESGRLHHAVTAERLVLVCTDSLLGFRNEEEIPRLAQLLISDGYEPVRS
jgi:SRSO17 transposase